MTGPAICGIEFQKSAFRLEWQQNPLLEELDAYQRYLNGKPLLPSGWAEWQAWLDRVEQMTLRCTISRVVLLDEQPTRYQEWRMWAAAWHRRAGENILFMPLRDAENLGIPIGNWWLFDDATVLDPADITRQLITGPEVRHYHAWRDLAVAHATATETIVA